MVFRLIEDMAHHEEITKTTNLSFGGCRFLASSPLEIETLLELHITARSGVASADASVVFSNELRTCHMYQVGVKFIRLLPNDRRLLETALPGLRYRQQNEGIQVSGGRSLECSSRCPWFKLRDRNPEAFDLVATLVPLRGRGGRVCDHCWAAGGTWRKPSF